MAGSYELLKNGKARLQYMLNGERYSNTVVAKNDSEARKALAHFVVSVEKGNFVRTDYTYSQFCQLWLNEHLRPNCSESYILSVKNYLNNRILPFLGKYKIEKINTQILRKFFTEMKSWKTDSKKPEPISRATYVKIYKIVSSSLQKAFEWEILNSNPCKRIPLKSLHLEKLPSEIQKMKACQNKKIRSYDLKTYKKVLELLDNHCEDPFKDTDRIKKIAVETSLKTGFCMEELAGLDWERDWDYEKSTLSINIVRIYIKKKGWIEKEPKANSRRRTIKISASLNKLLYILRQMFPENEHIFFGLINFNSFTNWFKKWQKNNNISPILTSHELRHSHATILLKLGVNIKAISIRLGHSSVQITLDVYVEYLPEDDSEIAEMIEAV